MFKRAINKCTYIHTTHTHTYKQRQTETGAMYIKQFKRIKKKLLAIYTFCFEEDTEEEEEAFTELKNPFNS